jgi:hypothetical protein
MHENCINKRSKRKWKNLKFQYVLNVKKNY